MLAATYRVLLLMVHAVAVDRTTSQAGVQIRLTDLRAADNDRGRGAGTLLALLQTLCANEVAPDGMIWRLSRQHAI
jgi:hypothetical protein